MAFNVNSSMSKQPSGRNAHFQCAVVVLHLVELLLYSLDAALHFIFLITLALVII